MKRLTLLLLLLMIVISIPTLAQILVNGVDFREEGIKYIEIVGTNKSLLGKKLIVTIDYGQKYDIWKPQRLTDLDGKKLIFNSMVEALNYFDKLGWTYIDNLTYSEGNQSVIRYLLKRRYRTF